MLGMPFLRRILLIVGSIFALMIGAIVLPGYMSIISASNAESPHDRANDYEFAAQRLPWDSQLYEKAAFAALQAEEYARAVTLFKIARQKSVLTPAGQFELGKAYFLQGDQKNAIAEWQALPNGDPATVSAGPYLADAYHAQAKFDDEEQVLRQWLALDPENVDAQYRLGLLLFADASSEAIPLLEFVASGSPTLKPAADGLNTALKTALNAGPLATRLTYCGQTLAASGAWSLALRAFSHATQADATYALAWAWLGEALQQTNSGNPLDALQRAAHLAPDLAQVHALFALYWERQGNWQKAQDSFDAAARLEPQNAAWQISLGETYVHLGDLMTALAYYQNAVKLSPQDAQTWRALALFSIENHMDEDNVARNAALRAYALDPENAQSLDILGRALLESGQYDAAETFFKKALKTAPQDAAPAYHLALLYLQINQPDLAKKYLQSAQALDPNGLIGRQASGVLARYFP